MAKTFASKLSVPQDGIGSMEEGILLDEIATQAELDQEEARLRGMTVDEYYEYLEDLNNDAEELPEEGPF